MKLSEKELLMVLNNPNILNSVRIELGDVCSIFQDEYDDKDFWIEFEKSPDREEK